MSKKIDRRDFFKKGTQAGVACCAFMMTSKVTLAESLTKMFEDQKIDPKRLNYCGHICPEDCKFYLATIENNETKKKEAFDIWNIKARYDVDFDSKTAVCWRCKNNDKTQGVVVSNCTVRECAMKKGFDSCIQCDELTSCNKDLWKTFPDFYERIKEMQVKYKEQIA